MMQRFLAILFALTLTSSVFAASVDLPGTTSGATGSGDTGLALPVAPSSQDCGPASAAPCPTPGDPADQGSPPPKSANPALSASVSVGSPAKPFKLQDLDGAPFAFNPLALAKPTLVIFWSLFCAPCKEEFPLYGELAEQYGPKGLDVLTVNVDGPNMAKTAKNYLKMQGLSLRVAMDKKEGKHFLSADTYGVTGTPSLFLIDTKGTVRWKHAGRVESEQLEGAIRQALGS